jgi:hypothetical protein
MALNCLPEVAQEMAVICSHKNLQRILIRHGRNIKARQTRMRRNHQWNLTMSDLLVKKQQSSPKKRYSPPFSAVRRSNHLLFCRTTDANKLI